MLLKDIFGVIVEVGMQVILMLMIIYILLLIKLMKLLLNIEIQVVGIILYGIYKV